AEIQDSLVDLLDLELEVALALRAFEITRERLAARSPQTLSTKSVGAVEERLGVVLDFLGERALFVGEVLVFFTELVECVPSAERRELLPLELLRRLRRSVLEGEQCGAGSGGCPDEKRADQNRQPRRTS